MAQDIKEMLKDKRETTIYTMKEGHKKRFSKLLDKEFPRKRNPSIFIWGTAAGFLVLMCLGAYMYTPYTNKGNTKIVEKNNGVPDGKSISLGDLSPKLKKIEDYYVVNIGLELSTLEISGDTRVLVDSYMEQMAELDLEYKRLNAELNGIGPNDKTIAALLKNLQLRLQLLQKLKYKLNKLKSSENETVTSNSI